MHPHSLPWNHARLYNKKWDLFKAFPPWVLLFPLLSGTSALPATSVQSLSTQGMVVSCFNCYSFLISLPILPIISSISVHCWYYCNRVLCLATSSFFLQKFNIQMILLTLLTCSCLNYIMASLFSRLYLGTECKKP